MSYINVFKIAITMLMLIFLLSCTNTRVILEGTKKILKNDEESIDNDSINKENTLVTNGHYKIGNPYEVNGRRYIPRLLSYYDEIGIASWYGPKFHNKATANGEIFDQNTISAAHKILPLPSIVKVTNMSNNKTMYIRINDRGPFVNNRIIDLSKKAAIKLNFFKKGVTKVRVKLIDTGPHLLDKKFLNQSYLSKYSKNIEKDITKIKKRKASIVLQVGAFTNKQNATNLLNYLKTKISDNLYLKNYSNDESNLLYKVFVGPFKEVNVAKNVAKKLLKLGYNSIYLEE